jgi:hypothetical protein
MLAIRLPESTVAISSSRSLRCATRSKARSRLTRCLAWSCSENSFLRQLRRCGDGLRAVPLDGPAQTLFECNRRLVPDSPFQCARCRRASARCRPLRPVLRRHLCSRSASAAPRRSNYQMVLICKQLRIFASFVTKGIPSAIAVAPIIRSQGSAE